MWTKELKSLLKLVILKNSFFLGFFCPFFFFFDDRFLNTYTNNTNMIKKLFLLFSSVRCGEVMLGSVLCGKVSFGLVKKFMLFLGLFRWSMVRSGAVKYCDVMYGAVRFGLLFLKNYI